MVAGRDDEGPWVYEVRSPIQAAPALAGSGDLARAAVEWSRAEEHYGASLEDLAWVLEGLSGLARRATAKDEHLYCWVCL